MKKISISLLVALIFTNVYSNVSSTMFSNSFNSNFNNMPSISSNLSEDKHVVNKTVAVVNNKPITSFELEQEVSRLKSMQPNAILSKEDELNLKKQALKNLISQSVLLQLAERNNITVTDQQVNSAIQDIAIKNGVSVESLKLNIEASGISFDSYKKQIKKQLMINQFQQQAISQQVYVSPEEIQKYIKDHKQQFDKEMQPIKLYTLKNLVVPLPECKQSQQRKIDFLKKISIAVNNHNIDFNDVVKQFSQAQNVSSDGLVIQSAKFESIPSIYKKYVKKLKNHQVSQPFIVNHTIQMIYVDNIEEKPPILNKKVKKYYVYAIEVKLNDSMNDQGAKSYLERVRRLIKKDKNFSKIAIKYNQDYEHLNGSFKWVSEIDNPPILPPATFEQLNKLKENELSEPFKADDKTWMIIKYTKTKDYDASEQLEEQQALKDIYAEKAQESYKTWLASIESDAYVEILDNDLKDANL
ncbi:MAG: SurA N-terminal domain-containing protein [Francisella sp.]